MSTLKTNHRGRLQAGFTIIETTVALAIIMIVAAIAVPNLMQAWSDMKLRSVGAQVADLMQQARMRAAKNNATYPIRFQLNGAVQQAFIDLNNNGALDNLEPVMDLPQGVTAAAAAPNGGGGQPPAYTLTTDTTSGTPYSNTDILAFSPRGLPCNYNSPPACTTPAPTYFVYYFQGAGQRGWAAVLVTKAGRTKTFLWNGTSWQ